MHSTTDTTPITFRYDVVPADAALVRHIVSGTGYFTAAEVDVAVELIDERLAKGISSGYEFVFAQQDGQTVGYTCYGPIACTVGSYDLYWIAVDRVAQRQGIGRLLVAETERLVCQAQGRNIYVETSGRPAYASTRSFYHRLGYQQAAVLPDFYDVGDSKIVYQKQVTGDNPISQA